jgi:ubiquinone/menaquinone biosynthesis C-methylase UbiE
VTTALLHDAEVSSRFDAAVGRFKRDVDDEDYRLRAVVRALDGLDRPTVLDLGCGKGRFARRLESSGASVVGIDLSARMLGEAEGFDRVRGSARSLPFADGAFDAVVAVETFEHIRDVDAALAEARRVLRSGGRLVVIDKNAASLDARRPWLPSLVVKRIDEHRGLWMYPAWGPVRERWFWPRRFAQRLAAHFAGVSIDHLLSPAEADRALFRAFPTTRLMACWTARVPGGIA